MDAHSEQDTTNHFRQRTGAKMRNISVRIWLENMSTKYIVASRWIVSKMLGMPGYLGFLARIKTIKNARTSTVTPDKGSVEYEAYKHFQAVRTHRRQPQCSRK